MNNLKQPSHNFPSAFKTRKKKEKKKLPLKLPVPS